MISGLFFFPPVLLKIRRLGCLQLAHKPEIWHLNPFIKSWALKQAEDRSWSKGKLLPWPGPVRIYSKDQTPRAWGVSMFAFLGWHTAALWFSMRLVRFLWKTKTKWRARVLGTGGCSQNAHSVTFHLLRHEFMWSLNNYLFHTKPDISLKPTNTACRHIS